MSAVSKLVFADNCFCYQDGFSEHSRANWGRGRMVFQALNEHCKTEILTYPSSSATARHVIKKCIFFKKDSCIHPLSSIWEISPRAENDLSNSFFLFYGKFVLSP